MYSHESDLPKRVPTRVGYKLDNSALGDERLHEQYEAFEQKAHGELFHA